MGLLKSKCQCDRCKKIYENGQVDYNGYYYCERCEIKIKIESLENEKNELIEWLKETHLKELKDMKLKIKNLKNDLNNL